MTSSRTKRPQIKKSSVGGGHGRTEGTRGVASMGRSMQDATVAVWDIRKRRGKSAGKPTNEISGTQYISTNEKKEL